MENFNSIIVYQAARPTFTAEVKGQRLESSGLVSDAGMDYLAGRETALALCEGVYEVGNIHHHLIPKLRYSMSVGDVVSLCDDVGEVRHYMVDMCGFKRVKCTEHYERAGDDVNEFIRVID